MFRRQERQRGRNASTGPLQIVGGDLSPRRIRGASAGSHKWTKLRQPTSQHPPEIAHEAESIRFIDGIKRFIVTMAAQYYLCLYLADFERVQTHRARGPSDRFLGY